jgi:hypothetical protein
LVESITIQFIALSGVAIVVLACTCRAHRSLTYRRGTTLVLR